MDHSVIGWMRAAGIAPLVLAGDGFLCIGVGSSGLFGLMPPLVLDSSGAATRVIDFGSAPTGVGAGQILPGSTWNFQMWHRDCHGRRRFWLKFDRRGERDLLPLMSQGSSDSSCARGSPLSSHDLCLAAG